MNPTSSNVLELLDAAVAGHPDRTAVSDDTDSLTFRELDTRSKELARTLRELIGPMASGDKLVGLCVEPTVDVVVAAWAILRAGAAYLPLEVDYPDDRLRTMVADSQVGVVVTRAALSDRVREIVAPGVHVHVLDDGAAETREPPHLRRPLAAPGPDDLAYVIYTSGSTGTPKGVAVPHSALAHQVRWLVEARHLGPDVVMILKTPLSFDAAQWELLGCAGGAHVVVAGQGVYRDPDALVDLVVAHGVTTIQAVPTLLAALVETDRLGATTTLRELCSGGEALGAPLARKVLETLPGVILTNLYGPTECTINVTSHRVTPADLDGPAVLPIGTPVPGITVRVVGPYLDDVPEGETGELLVGGPQLARGYLHREDLTAARFTDHVADGRMYRTGDMVHRDHDGVLHFVGRTDDQVKLRGHRIELDEVAHRAEDHPWVRRASAVVVRAARTGRDSLVVCAELDPRQAPVMDQGVAGMHHRTKADRVQVRAQLSAPGLRDVSGVPAECIVELPFRVGHQWQRRRTFSRKTYRRYLGGPVTRADLEALLTGPETPFYRRRVDQITFEGLAELLRWFGQFHSDERLLAKYAYASPGALYATQLFVGVAGVAGVATGTYYYDPVGHRLARVSDHLSGLPTGATDPVLEFHLLGRSSAVETVYQRNVREVLEIEGGHMVGLLSRALADHGLDVVPVAMRSSAAELLVEEPGDLLVGSFRAVPCGDEVFPQLVTTYVQAHGDRVAGLPHGLHRWDGTAFTPVSDGVVEARHVIAINQDAYHQASFGIGLVTRDDEALDYVALGRALHMLQDNRHAVGLMSSGYSSKSGHPLAAATRLSDLVAADGPAGASYFAVGGRVSAAQLGSEGMDEDAVHMRGPAELIRDDLARALPTYMMPSRIVLLESLPVSPNGKMDRAALCTLVADGSGEPSPIVRPRTRTERALTRKWSELLDLDVVSADDDFFAVGGDSLSAVRMVNQLNRELDWAVPVQALFREPRLDRFAAEIDRHLADSTYTRPRLVPLNPTTQGRPVFFWPGLGGSPVGLRRLAGELAERPVLGIQAWGLNEGEDPYPTISEMARADVEEIRRAQPTGPYTLAGYSFGARVAFETAWQLEREGETVDSLLLVCPGNPIVTGSQDAERVADWTDAAYVRTLGSVFTGTVHGPVADRCVAEVRDEASLGAYLSDSVGGVDPEVMRRILRVVEATFRFKYTFEELTDRRVMAQVAVVKALGDDYSFVDRYADLASERPTVVTVTADHYSVLRDEASRLAQTIRDLRLLFPDRTHAKIN